jgi:SAM-dependent methyltransferase
MSQVEGEPGTLDWGAGRYEATAEQLAPVAQVVVERAAPEPGERVLDLGCGTGNGALLAARTGASVVGIDPAPRLLEVARTRAIADGVSVTFEAGDAASIPLPDQSVDVIISVFAVIFAPDADAAAAQMVRVLRPSGRIVLTAWLPTGAIFEMNSVAIQTVAQAVGAPAGPPGFPWHHQDALVALFGRYGLGVDVEEHTIAFRAASVDQYLDDEMRDHPLAVTGVTILERLGRADALRARLHDILSEANEDPAAFQATSRYVVVTLRHAG